MPTVRVEIFAGRSPELKKALASEITDAVVKHIGCPVQAVMVIIEDVPKENWMIGGKPCSELFPNV
jgi:4-oxalocrotonate tautomerase